MGYSVCYLIDVPGREFNEIQDPQYRASDRKLEEFTQSACLWDGKLSGSSIEYLVELSGTLTVVFLTIKASAYKYAVEVREHVEHWEGILHSILSDTKIMRVDELNLEEWESISEEFWFREVGAFDRAWQWFQDCSQSEKRTLEIPHEE